MQWCFNNNCCILLFMVLCLTSDIDECDAGLSNCPENMNCHNLNGSFSCGIGPVIEIQEAPGSYIVF